MEEVRKRGRPKKETSKEERFDVRLSDDEKSILNFMSDELNISRSDVMRQALKMMYVLKFRA